MSGKVRDFFEWVDNPSVEDIVCQDPLRDALALVKDARQKPVNSYLDPVLLDRSDMYVKLAELIYSGLIVPEGDVVFVRDGDSLYPAGEATALLARYMHVDNSKARKATDVLESEFVSWSPIAMNKVNRGMVKVVHGDRVSFVDMRTLEKVDGCIGLCEYGTSEFHEDVAPVLDKFFGLVNASIGQEPYFAEQMLMYPYNLPFREKSFCIVGNGGNGKSMLMKMAGKLYGRLALVDSPQPTFKGHDAATIAYNMVGKRMVTFNDVENPSSQFLEWLKRMVTGNLEVKTPAGSWLSVPTEAVFLMETNHSPEILDIEAHRRRFVIRQFDPGFKLAEHMDKEELDLIGDRGKVTTADLVMHMARIKPNVYDWAEFEQG